MVVNSFEDDFVLELGTHLAGAAWEHVDFLDLLSSEEVLDFNGLAVLGNSDVDGEMGVDHSHFIFVPLESFTIIIELIEKDWIDSPKIKPYS